MIAPLDALAFAAFEKRCEVTGKALPGSCRDVLEMDHAQKEFNATKMPSVRFWADYDGRSVYWFTYPHDLGPLRLEGAVRKTADDAWKSFAANDAAINANARGEHQVKVAEAWRAAKARGEDYPWPGSVA